MVGLCLYTLSSLNFTLSVSEYVTTNVKAKPDTFLREPNPCYTEVFHMCSCRTITVFKKIQQYTTQGKMSDRSSKPSFPVSRNLKNAKYHFIEANIDKLTESSDITNSDTTQVSSDTWNSVSSSTWLCATSNMKNTARKTCQTSLLFLEPLQAQNLKRKSGGDMAHYVPPRLKSGGDTSPMSPTKLRPWISYVQPAARTHAVQSKVLCDPVSFSLMCTYNTMKTCVFILIFFNSTVSMQLSLMTLYHILRTGKFPRVHWHLGAKLIFLVWKTFLPTCSSTPVIFNLFHAATHFATHFNLTSDDPLPKISSQAYVKQLCLHNRKSQ